ncbi:putative 28S rRNA (cytosine-C(5))-methyltransferase isoform X3 [Cucumis melo var. makuwa]|uniref:28S rRNA (Cytosine-C(5))-methyltransferase isoform X3 n=2 Tax=Cucumis melo var. makuwa TaxID=1194695 RepID=A0A5A7V1G0_CUCMM|nr:putative 28S rRNA (cytosine-C(5))-methyltransferase isoform X3 [Cucumis melo var. makuwa]
MVPDFLILPPGSDLHDHPLVANGRIFLQGKASSMVEEDLDPKPGWKVRAILLDPSSSGYGTVAVRLDPLLSPHDEETASGDDLE